MLTALCSVVRRGPCCRKPYAEPPRTFETSRAVKAIQSLDAYPKVMEDYVTGRAAHNGSHGRHGRGFESWRRRAGAPRPVCSVLRVSSAFSVAIPPIPHITPTRRCPGQPRSTLSYLISRLLDVTAEASVWHRYRCNSNTDANDAPFDTNTDTPLDTDRDASEIGYRWFDTETVASAGHRNSCLRLI